MYGMSPLPVSPILTLGARYSGSPCACPPPPEVHPSPQVQLSALQGCSMHVVLRGFASPSDTAEHRPARCSSTASLTAGPLPDRSVDRGPRGRPRRVAVMSDLEYDFAAVQSTQGQGRAARFRR